MSKLVTCPQCGCQVRNEHGRLKRHLQRCPKGVRAVLGFDKPPPIFDESPISGYDPRRDTDYLFRQHRCVDCGKPAIVGEDRCYSCNCD